MIGRHIALKLKFMIFIVICSTVMMFSQVSFGIRAGVSMQNLTGNYENSEKLKNDYVPGFHAGVAMEIAVVPDFFFQTGLLYSVKGAGNVYETEGQKVSISYLELPLHLAFKSHDGLVVGLGPFLAWGISGSFQFAGGKEPIVFRNTITSTEQISGVPYLRPLDSGADIFLGYKFSFGFTCLINAQFGLLNLRPKTESETTRSLLRNTGFSISVEYWF